MTSVLDEIDHQMDSLARANADDVAEAFAALLDDLNGSDIPGAMRHAIVETILAKFNAACARRDQGTRTLH